MKKTEKTRKENERKEQLRKEEEAKKEAWRSEHEMAHNLCTCDVKWKPGVSWAEDGTEEWAWTLYCAECGFNLFYTNINEEGLIYGIKSSGNDEFAFSPTPEAMKKYTAMIATLDKGKHDNQQKMDCQPYRKRRPAVKRAAFLRDRERRKTYQGTGPK